MDDVLAAHIERVTASNSEFTAAAGGAREAANSALRAHLAAFGERLVAVARDAEAARAELSSALEAEIAAAKARIAAAFDDNIAAIALSISAAQGEFAARSEFLSTGRLPSGVAPLPRAGVELAFRDSDPSGGELVVLPRRSPDAPDAEAADSLAAPAQAAAP